MSAINNRIEYLKQKANELPQSPGIYLMKDAHGGILYVGKAKQLKQRVTSYFRKNTQHTKKILRLVHNVVDFETINVDTELDALLLECQLIQAHRPIYNRQLTNFLNYEYIIFDGRTINQTNQWSPDALGPFRLSKQLPEIIEILTETFLLPSINSYKLLSLSKQLPMMKTYTLEKRLSEIQLFFRGESDVVFDYLDQRLDYVTEHLLFEQANQLVQQTKLLRAFYNEVCAVNSLSKTPELRFEVPIERAEDNCRKVYQLSYGRLIHSQIVSSSQEFVAAPLAQETPLLPTDLDPLHIVVGQLRKLKIDLPNR